MAGRQDTVVDQEMLIDSAPGGLHNELMHGKSEVSSLLGVTGTVGRSNRSGELHSIEKGLRWVRSGLSAFDCLRFTLMVTLNIFSNRAFILVV
jgi:hypothetical protein